MNIPDFYHLNFGIPVVYPNSISKYSSRRENLSYMGYMIQGTLHPTDGGWMLLNATSDEDRALIAELMQLEKAAGESADLVFDYDAFDDDIFDDSDERFRCLYPDLGGES